MTATRHGGWIRGLRSRATATTLEPVLERAAGPKETRRLEKELSMSSSLSRALLGAACVTALGTLAGAQNRFATSVAQYSPGPNANPSFVDPTRALGGPQGGGLAGGGLDIVALGVGGTLTLGFDVTIVDGPGADLTVSENGFTFGGPSSVFAEVALVEVSTDGVNFVRFPTRYSGPVGPLPPFGSSDMGTFGGLCGGLPVVANVQSGLVDPFDPVVSGGEALDLAELANDPAVVNGLVDLQAIHFVRLVDVPEGVFLDSFGNTIWDHGGATGSADIDAVTAIHYAGGVSAAGPEIDFEIDANGFLVLRIGDPDGLQDLVLSSLAVSIDLQPSSFNTLRQMLVLVQRTPTQATLATATPIVGAGLKMALALSVRDHAGHVSADQILIPD